MLDCPTFDHPGLDCPALVYLGVDCPALVYLGVDCPALVYPGVDYTWGAATPSGIKYPVYWRLQLVCLQDVSEDMIGPSRPSDRPSAGNNVVTRGDELSTLFDALQDSDCRNILEATSDEALSASEMASRCDLPLSTTYRKVEKLQAADLVSENIRIRQSGKHASEYVAAVEDLTLTLDGDGGLTVRLVAPAETAVPGLLAPGD